MRHFVISSLLISINLFVAALLGACGAAAVSAQATSTVELIPSLTAEPTRPIASPTRPVTARSPVTTLAPTLALVTAEPDATTKATAATVVWQEMPVVPVVSDRAREIFQRGLELGRNPQAFAKIGDCGSAPSWFLGVFDGPPDLYRLGEYSYLQEAIAHFAGSFGRTSVAARPGFSASSIFAAFWADPEQCKSNEGPLICEIRVTNASYAFIMMGTNDAWNREQFEPQMRRAIEDLIGRGVVPILATKADNLEQDNSLNAAIARLANEYDIPLWNFWAAVQPLPNFGLQDDGVHLTWAGNRFDDADSLSRGWPLRNLTALQALDAVWKGTSK